jgi:hypothetical protein
VQHAEDDPESDLVHVTYDADKVTTQMMLELIRSQGFEAEGWSK